MKFLKSMAVFFLIAALAGCTADEKHGVSEKARPEVSGVTIARIEPVAVSRSHQVTGTVKAVSESRVAGRMMGAVLEVLVDAGDRVKKGALLARLDDRDMVEKVAQARAGLREAQQALAAAEENMTLAEITHGRYQALFQEKALSRQELDQVTSNKKMAAFEYERVGEMISRAEAAIREAEVGLSFTRITAPVSGLITAKNVEPGSMALPGAPLFTIEDTSAYEVEAAVAEALAEKVAVGMEVHVEIPATGEEMTGTVSEKIAAIDPLSRTFRIRVALAEKNLASGRFVKVFLPMGDVTILQVPVAALVTKGQLTGVYTVDDDRKITYRLVRLGKEQGGRVEILSGIRAGEQVIVGDADRASDGAVLGQDVTWDAAEQKGGDNE